MCGEAQRSKTGYMYAMKKKILQNKMAVLLTAVYIISLIPILMASVYAYPQADDWTYSWRTHVAWEDTHSLLAVGKAVVETVKDSYVNWQGTFSSIALMSLQPAIWGERLYALTPFIMIGMLTAATLILVRELFRRVKGTEWISVSMLALLVTVQRMVCVPVAFYWYNGAVHYMFMYSVGLLLAACLLKTIRRNRPGIMICSCILAIVLGGGNLVTALAGAIGLATVVVWLLLSGRRKRVWTVLLPLVCNFLAFGINIAAPGNWIRQDAVGAQDNPIMSILRSFYYGIEFPAIKWLDWTIILFVLFLIPIAWKVAGKVEFDFPLPLLIVAYSYCFISAMFTPLDFALKMVDIKRAQNIIFSAFILILALNVIYLTGWFRKHVRVSLAVSIREKWPFRFSSACYAALSAAGLWCFLLSVIPSPEYFTASLAVQDMRNGSAQAYADTAERNIEILKGEGDEVDVYEIPKDSQLLTSDDIDKWHYGTKYFYRKNKVNVIPFQKEE